MIDVRFGRDFSEDDLRPDDYETSGGIVRSQLLRGSGSALVSEAASTYSVDGIAYADYQFPMQAGGKLYTKVGAEVFGATRAFIFAGERNVAIRTGFHEPHPDLAVTLDGIDAALEVTQVRPKGAFTAALSDLTERFRARRYEDERLAAITEFRSISLGFVKELPRKHDIPALVSSITEWLVGEDWSRGDPAVPEQATFANFLHAVRSFAPNAERPISAAWLHNGGPNFPDLIANRIHLKKAKSYKGSPLWLAVTSVSAIGALPEVARMRIDPGQFDRIYITDAQDAVVVRRLSG